MARAAERTAPAILSAGAIVVVAMLVLAVADFNATREMGPILALGVAVMVCRGADAAAGDPRDARTARLLARGAARRAEEPRGSAAIWAGSGGSSPSAGDDGRRVTAMLVVGRARRASAGASRSASPRRSAIRPNRSRASR